MGNSGKAPIGEADNYWPLLMRCQTDRHREQAHSYRVFGGVQIAGTPQFPVGVSLLAMRPELPTQKQQAIKRFFTESRETQKQERRFD